MLRMAHAVCQEISNPQTIASATVAARSLPRARGLGVRPCPMQPSCPLQAPPAPCRPPCPLQAPPAPSSPPAPCRPPCPLQSGPLSSCLWERGPAIPRGPSHSQTEKLSPVRQSEWLKVTQQRAGGPGRPLSFALPQTHGLSEDVPERQAPSRNGTDSLSPSGARSQGCI